MRLVLAGPGEFQSLHRHGDHRLVVFISGSMKEESFDGVGYFKRGEFVFRPAWFAHADRACDSGAGYVRLPLTNRAAMQWVTRFGWRAARGVVELDRLPHGDDVLASAYARPYVNDVAASWLRMAAADLASEQQPRVAEVARRHGVELSQFSRCFSRGFGMSPVTYRRQARLQRALRLVFEQRQTLASVAADCGFHDQSHLSAELKREIGITPAALVRSAANAGC